MLIDWFWHYFPPRLRWLCEVNGEGRRGGFEESIRDVWGGERVGANNTQGPTEGAQSARGWAVGRWLPSHDQRVWCRWRWRARLPRVLSDDELDQVVVQIKLTLILFFFLRRVQMPPLFNFLMTKIIKFICRIIFVRCDLYFFLYVHINKLSLFDFYMNQ